MTTPLAFTHLFEPATNLDRPPVLLLHGTGGDEHDLIELGKTVAPGSALLSPRGKVVENGQTRFFKRRFEGGFDEADLRARAAELAEFVEAARNAYGLGAPLALGYSNGANIAAALLLLQPHALAGAALLRAMTPLQEPPQPDLSGKPVLLLSGQGDPIVTADDAADLLAAAGAKVEHQALLVDHGMAQADVTITAEWFKQR